MRLGAGLYKVKYKGRYQLLRISLIAGKKYYRLDHGSCEPIDRLFELGGELELISIVNEDLLANEDIRQARITISWKDKEEREFSMTVCDVWSLRNILLEFPFLKRPFNYLPRRINVL
jgi:hypothetical protein